MPSVNERAAAAAERNQIFCVRADSAVGGNARTPAVLRRGPMTVAVNAGDDPLRAVALRDEIGTALDIGTLASRPRRPSGRGRVALVGGGPGDPDLITVRGRRLVAEADVVVVDRLAPRELLLALPDDVEIIDCGKAAHRHNLTQDQINAVLIDRAQRRRPGRPAQGRRSVHLRPRHGGGTGLPRRRRRRRGRARAQLGDGRSGAGRHPADPPGDGAWTSPSCPAISIPACPATADWTGRRWPPDRTRWCC